MPPATEAADAGDPCSRKTATRSTLRPLTERARPASLDSMRAPAHAPARADQHEAERNERRKVALVTGGSRGVGRGIAEALVQAGITVYVTGRSVASADLPEEVTRVSCDHSDDAQVAAVFERIGAEQGRLDVLVNNAWGGYERMSEAGEFTWTRPFWLQPLWRWDAMMTVAVRGSFVAAQHAARMMVAAGSGLIVNISYWAAQKYLGNALYGCAKAATDKLTSDMAHELASHGVCVVSLYPGLVRTEA